MSTPLPTLGLLRSPVAPRICPSRSQHVTSPLPVFRQIEVRDLALDRIRQGLCVFDAQRRLVLFNRLYAEMHEVDPAKLWIGMSMRDMLDLRYAAGTGPDMPLEEYALWRERIGIADKFVDSEVTLGNGRVHAVHYEPITGGGFVITFEDITERRRAEARFRYMAHHDALTGLPNRAQFTERLEGTLAHLRGQSRPEDYRPILGMKDEMVAVLFLDLDHFKDVNDTLGHAAGDALLQLVAGRIGQCLRATDTLARFGGDEFAVLLSEQVATADQVADVAHRVIQSASMPYMLDGQEAVIGVSVGITLCARGDEDALPAALLSQADMALYQAKMEKRGTYCFFQAKMHVALLRRKELERDLRRALADGNLEVHYQPIVATETQRIIGAEALARWWHPEYGFIPPSEFIPLAEHIGLIGELGAWVLRTACARAMFWKGLRVAVNLSPEQVRRPGLVDLVTKVLAETGLPASQLELEITEGSLLQESTVTLVTLDRLRALGVSIALDDFGTGFSSLSYLRKYPFTKLKIDRSFISAMATDPGTAAIVQAVITLGSSLAMRVTAEGIETTKQLDLLAAIGCDEAQGYLFGRPCPGAAFERMVARERSAMRAKRLVA